MGQCGPGTPTSEYKSSGAESTVGIFIVGVDIPRFLGRQRPSQLTLPGRPVHPCGLSLGSMCESRLLPPAKDNLCPLSRRTVTLQGPPFTPRWVPFGPAALEGTVPQGPQKETCAGSCPEGRPPRRPRDFEQVGPAGFRSTGTGRQPWRRQRREGAEGPPSTWLRCRLPKVEISGVTSLKK